MCRVYSLVGIVGLNSMIILFLINIFLIMIKKGSFYGEF